MTTPLAYDSRAFPAEPPPDLNDPQKVMATDWEAFSSVTRMTDHWDRPGWGPGHRAYYWMLAFPDAPELIAEARSCQQALADLTMDVVPEDGLHITMNKIGNCAEVQPSTIDTLARLTHGSLGDRFEIHAHPMAGSRGAVRFSVSPWTPLVEVYATLHRAGQRAGVLGGKPSSLFRPHLGILYNDRDRPAPPVVEAVGALRSRPSVAVQIRHVDLVELRREGKAYRWRILHSLPLAGQTPSA